MFSLSKFLQSLFIGLIIGLFAISVSLAQTVLKEPYNTTGLCPFLSESQVSKINGYDVIEATYGSDSMVLELPLTPFTNGPNVIAFQQSPAFSPGTNNHDGDLILQLRKVTLFEDNEGTLEHPFFEGGAWSNIYIEVVSEGGDILDRMVLKGPFMSDNGKCEWGDTDVSYFQQIVHYGNYGLYNWTQNKTKKVRILFFESDEFDLGGWKKTYMGDFTIDLDKTLYPAQLSLKDTSFASDQVNDLDIVVQTRDLTAFIKYLPGNPDAPPAFNIKTGSNQFYVVEITSDPKLFAFPEGRNQNNFFSTQEKGFSSAGEPVGPRHETGFQLSKESWNKLLASGAKTFYYRLITTSDLQRRDFQTSLWDSEWADAPSFTIP